ncbi:VOC family protein [candidate division CSSED10-310 bacterium]|uniref:VOC family protein n=1 Tax=candidate division CSSED10-310 bacterium TaxID=2855610 RepID=A0ABV6Z5S4_UNCC1
MKLHHIGKVVRDLDEAQTYYRDIFGLQALGPPVVDPIQQVEVVFIETGPPEFPTIELIKPLSASSPVSKFLEKGEGIHHLCFETEDIKQSIAELKAKGSLILGKIVPGKGHGDKMTVWIYTPSKELVELVEKEKSL